MLATISYLLYMLAVALFIFGLKMLSSPATARRGNQVAAAGMALAIVTTLDCGNCHESGQPRLGNHRLCRRWCCWWIRSQDGCHDRNARNGCLVQRLWWYRLTDRWSCGIPQAGNPAMRSRPMMPLLSPLRF
jgi:hypothetical protein